MKSFQIYQKIEPREKIYITDPDRRVIRHRL